MADTYRKQLARDLLGAIKRLDSRVKALTEQISDLIDQSGTNLTEIGAVGPIVAAKIIGHSGDHPPIRYPQPLRQLQRPPHAWTPEYGASGLTRRAAVRREGLACDGGDTR